MTRSCLTAFLLALSLGVQDALGSSLRASPASQSRNLVTRVVGGTKANPKRYPYYTMIKAYSEYRSEGWFCGGSLIARDVVLTAADCITPYDSDDNITAVDVWVNSTTTDLSDYEYNREAVKLVVHPNYRRYRNVHNIGLIFLDELINGVPLVKLNKNASVPVASTTPTLEVMGLGAIGMDENHWSNTFTKELMRASIKPISMLACKKLYGSVAAGASKICAGGDGVTGVCVGDTGGPMILKKGSASSDILVGVTTNGRFSYRGDCIPLGEPDVYTRVSYYAQWIIDQRCEYSDENKPNTCPP